MIKYRATFKNNKGEIQSIYEYDEAFYHKVVAVRGKQEADSLLQKIDNDDPVVPYKRVLK